MGVVEAEFFGHDEWDAIARACVSAADDLNDIRVRGVGLVSLLIKSGQKNTVSGVFHAFVQGRLAELPGGMLPATQDDGSVPDVHADLLLFGNDIEVKTGALGSSGPSISTNKSYVSQVDPAKIRLLVGVNYHVSAVGGELKIRPFLVRAGWIGPSDYISSQTNGQVTQLSHTGYAKLYTLWHAPLLDLPASLVQGVGGVDGRSIAEALTDGSTFRRQALLRAASVSSIRAGKKAKWPLPEPLAPEVRKRA